VIATGNKRPYQPVQRRVGRRVPVLPQDVVDVATGSRVTAATAIPQSSNVVGDLVPLAEVGVPEQSRDAEPPVQVIRRRLHDAISIYLHVIDVVIDVTRRYWRAIYKGGGTATAVASVASAVGNK